MLNNISAAASGEAKISLQESGTARRRTQSTEDAHYFPHFMKRSRAAAKGVLFWILL